MPITASQPSWAGGSSLDLATRPADPKDCLPPSGDRPEPGCCTLASLPPGLFLSGPTPATLPRGHDLGWGAGGPGAWPLRLCRNRPFPLTFPLVSALWGGYSAPAHSSRSPGPEQARGPTQPHTQARLGTDSPHSTGGQGRAVLHAPTAHPQPPALAVHTGCPLPCLP